ncbi:ATP-binding cassette domain-containing protein [Sphingopyxis yananensis]|uniref:ATP-binding cassette domain-containing protein n=1 Tax=Sphingopyxis yananensis TaxID=2886687 RepID=UPI001D0F705A|nr:ATP-binding cassette domain-containing protein [Sphingopyxis yananensis]MCC2602519.1 ATP-binding cassette domain-containing protein [Sphingopyxis yananensis]
MDEAERCAQIFIFHHGQILADGPPDALRKRADGFAYVADALLDRPARVLQARLIDAPDRIVDAVPKGGDVHFIRRPACNEAALADLLSDTRFAPRQAELEDAFMLLLREQEDGPSDVADKPDAARSSDADMKPSFGGEPNGPVIVVRDLVRKFGDFTAVASTSFDVQRGEIFGLLGPNGAGKTTTFRTLCGLLPATSGHLEVAGVDLRAARAKARSRIGYVSQKFALYGNLSVRENLEFFAGAYGLRGERKQDRVKGSWLSLTSILPPRAVSCRSVTSSGSPWRRACCTSRTFCS